MHPSIGSESEGLYAAQSSMIFRPRGDAVPYHPIKISSPRRYFIGWDAVVK
jgi:hypothetical protein